MTHPSGQGANQEEELGALSSKLRETEQKAREAKRASNQLQKEKADADLALKSLELKYKQLSKDHEAAKEQMMLGDASSSSEHAAYLGECHGCFSLLLSFPHRPSSQVLC